LQQQFCKQHGCGHCMICKAIVEQKYEYLCWLAPMKQQYVKEELDAIATKMQFMLNEDEKFFFVLERAHLLSGACANSLLKVLEEPALGFHFIVIAEHAFRVVPTLLSRCIERRIAVHGLQPSTYASLFACFMLSNLIDFVREFDAEYHPAFDDAQVVQEFLLFWTERQKQGDPRAGGMINLILRSTQRLPLAGSSKLFWRNLFVQSLLIAS